MTPAGERTNICFIGKTNVGKSSIINAIIGQDVSIVSEQKGTTTDPVIKRFELLPAGPVTIFDTAGYDDFSSLSEKRLQATMKALFRADIVVLIIDERGWTEIDAQFGQKLTEMKIPHIIVQNKVDIANNSSLPTSRSTLPFSCNPPTPEHTQSLINAIISKISTLHNQPSSLLQDLIQKDDKIILVMPIDSSAPKGRIILPQVQVLREILDANAIALCCTENELSETLQTLKYPPKLVITDSQVVDFVAKTIDSHSTLYSQHSTLLTTFSILYARQRGEFDIFLEGIKTLKQIKSTPLSTLNTQHSTPHFLIAESCSHHTQGDDIGLYKIPNWLENYLGFRPNITKINGHDFPDDLEKYDIVIHCGGCMMTRTEILRRINECQRRGVPITNYGLLISETHGTLDRVIEVFNKK